MRPTRTINSCDNLRAIRLRLQLLPRGHLIRPCPCWAIDLASSSNDSRNDEFDDDDIKIEVATEDNHQKIFELINESYKVEDGNSGIAFKKTPRLLSLEDSGMGEAYEKNRVLIAKSTVNIDELKCMYGFRFPEKLLHRKVCLNV